MPNYCDFKMKIKGEKENIKKMISYLGAEYDFDIKEIDGEKEIVYSTCTSDKHFYRVFNVEPYEEEDEYTYEEDNIYSTLVYGYCAWSVLSCMTNDKNSYYNSYKDVKGSRATCLTEATKELNLIVEIYSTETGCEFAEHFIVDKGETLVEDCVDYWEEYDEENDEYTPKGGFEIEYSI